MAGEEEGEAGRVIGERAVLEDGLRSDGDAHGEARSGEVSGAGAAESISERRKGGERGGLGGAGEGERSGGKSERGAHSHGGERIGGEGEGESAQKKRVAIVKKSCLHKRLMGEIQQCFYKMRSGCVV